MTDGWIRSCPVCQRTSVYFRKIDRLVHEDGSANLDCWTATPFIDRWRAREVAAGNPRGMNLIGPA